VKSLPLSPPRKRKERNPFSFHSPLYRRFPGPILVSQLCTVPPGGTCACFFKKLFIQAKTVRQGQPLLPLLTISDPSFNGCGSLFPSERELMSESSPRRNYTPVPLASSALMFAYGTFSAAFTFPLEEFSLLFPLSLAWLYSHVQYCWWDPLLESR